MKSLKFFFRKLIRVWFWNVTNIKWSNKIVTKDQINYIVSLNDLYNEVESVPGHIIELGTGKGRNATIFGSLIKKKQQEKFKKYFGFDTFEGFTEEDIKKSPYLKDHNVQELDTFEVVNDFISSNKLDDVVTLIKGDIVKTLPEFIENKNHIYKFNKLLISLLYIDCNAYRPASFALDSLKEYFSKGALIVVDENIIGDETIALKNFCSENNLEIKSTKFKNHISSYVIWNK